MSARTPLLRPDSVRPGYSPAADRPCFAAGRLGLIAAGLVALIQLYFMARAIGPGLVSSFPGIDYDGYDWVLQGLYLRAMAHGAAGGPLLFLRSPVFVLATALDAALGSSGLVVAGVLCLAHFLTLAALLAIWRGLGASGPARALLFALAVCSPYAAFRGYVLADPLAMAAMFVSIRLILEWLATGNERRFRVAGVVGLIGGLTQLYGILPFFMGAALAFWRDRRAGRSGWQRVAFTMAVACLGGLTLFLWNAAIPHEDVPSQLGLLRPDLDMAAFYANIWVWFYGFLAPLALVLAVAALHRGRMPLSPATGYLAAVTTLFVGLLFFYHSDEARFSWYYFPLALCLAAAGTAWLEGTGRGHQSLAALALGLAVTLAQAVAITTGDDWQPKLAEIEYDPSESWVAKLLEARPVDRLDLSGQCGGAGVYCRQARLPDDAEPDERRILSDYIRLRLLLDGAAPTGLAHAGDAAPSAP